MSQSSESNFGDSVGVDWRVRGSNTGRGKKCFLSSKRLDRLWGPPNLIFNVIFPGVKRPERQVDYSPPSSDEIRNEWSNMSAPPIRLRGWDGDNFTFFTCNP
jgi:hypothetical protein